MSSPGRRRADSRQERRQPLYGGLVAVGGRSNTGALEAEPRRQSAEGENHDCLAGGSVKVELRCRENRRFAIEVDVYALTFDPGHRRLTMPLCIGDDWGRTIACPLQVAPTEIHFQWQTAFIQFERELDARAFGVWLVDADAEAREGYRTMSG